MTLSQVHPLSALDIDDADLSLMMDEDAFRLFYDRTAGPLWAYLSRIAGSKQAADDLVQEAYFRLLRSRHAFIDDDHRKNYLYRVATNLVRDAYRASQTRGVHDSAALETMTAPAPVADAAERAQVREAFARLKPRERALLWLAYAHGSSHAEIAGALGVKAGSIKLLLHRARRRLASMLTP
jgi:RNA polymerase sigma-70 factor (ECF subfamily)